MGKSLTGLIFVISAGVFSNAEAAYVIKLKNGNEYVTNRYWQEGRQILFDTGDGVFGIEQAFVGKIEKTDRVIKLVSRAVPAPDEMSVTAPNENAQDESKFAPKESTQAPAVKDLNDPFYKEFSSLKAQSESLLTMSAGDLDEYVKNLVALMKKIQTENKINKYLREYSELNEMANRAEEELKSRG